MPPAPRFLMVDPAHYEVAYAINPWMSPDAWSANATKAKARARVAWTSLVEGLRAAGGVIEVMPGVPGVPDLVFPANAAVVFDRRAVMARFRHPERQREEPHYRAFFEGLRDRGLLDEVHDLPRDLFHEGAGDGIWDAHRGHFWAGYGPRSSAPAARYLASYFDREFVALELTTAHFYHLDTCFCPLPGGEVMYCPDVFSPSAKATIAERVPRDKRIIATREEASSFSLNCVAIGRDLFMQPPPARLRRVLEERGYSCIGVDLGAFVMSGGAAFCMTLRLDLNAPPALKLAAE